MKKSKLLLIALFASILGMNAQQANNSLKVTAAFTAKQISSMTEEDLKWKNFIADNMCIINEMPADKKSGFPVIDLGNQVDANTATFNPLLTGIVPNELENQYFAIAGTSRTLFVYSKARLDVLYQRYQANQK